ESRNPSAFELPCRDRSAAPLRPSACRRSKSAEYSTAARFPLPGCPCLLRDSQAESRSFGPLSTSPAEPSLLQKPVIVTHDQLRFDHLHRVHGDANDNQQRRASEVEIHIKTLLYPERQC